MASKKSSILLGLVLFLSSIGQVPSAPQRPRALEFIGFGQATIQEPLSLGPLSNPAFTVNLTADTLTVDFVSILLCGEPRERLATNFTLYIRVDGVPVYTLPVVANYPQRLLVNISATVNGLSKGTHYVDIYLDAGAETVEFMSSPDTPTTLTVNQY